MSAITGWIDLMPPKDRRAILLGLLIVGPVALFMLAWRPMEARLDDARDRLIAERQLLDRELDLIAMGPDLPGQIRHMKERASLAEGRLINEPSLVLVEAALTDAIQNAAAQNRVLLEDIGAIAVPRGEEPPEGLQMVRLTVDGESDLQGVLSFMDAIEGHRYHLRVRGFALEPQMTREGGNGNNRSSRPTGFVEFQLIVDGFTRLNDSNNPREQAGDG